MCVKRRVPYWRAIRRINQNEPRLFTACRRAPVAIDSFCGSGGTADLDAAKKPSEIAALAMARSVMQVSYSPFGSHCIGGPARVVDSFPEGAVELLHCHGGSRPNSRPSSHFSAPTIPGAR